MSDTRPNKQEIELLTMLMEECAEIIHACAKIKRHGWLSHHPSTGVDNTTQLEDELKDFLSVANQLDLSGRLQSGVGVFTSPDLQEHFRKHKLPFTHHQKGKKR